MPTDRSAGAGAGAPRARPAGSGPALAGPGSPHAAGSADAASPGDGYGLGDQPVRAAAPSAAGDRPAPLPRPDTANPANDRASARRPADPANDATPTGGHDTTPPPAPDRPAPGPVSSSDARAEPSDGGYDLGYHGDREVGDGLVDLAVNVRAGTPPGWLAARIAGALGELGRYPDGRDAQAAVAGRHGRADPGEVLLTAGAAEAFVLLARALRPRYAVVVHPQFTEPEAALRAAGHRVHRVLLREADGFVLDPADVPEGADLVVVGNPTNPTSVLHPAAVLRQLARPGRTLVVDEAFMDAVPGEPESLAAARDVPGLLVLRSLTKTWGLAGLRIGYVLGARERLAALRGAQPLWAVSAPALVAAEACSGPAALAEAAEAAERGAADRAYLLGRLREVPGVRVAGSAPAGPFVLLRLPDGAGVREQLRTRGYAVRRADTFPGLGPDWLRAAVRDRATTDGFVAALAAAAEPSAP